MKYQKNRTFFLALIHPCDTELAGSLFIVCIWVWSTALCIGLDDVQEVSPAHLSVVHACCWSSDQLCCPVPKINSGKEANRLRTSNARHLNPLAFDLEAGRSFVHLSVNILPWSLSSWLSQRVILVPCTWWFLKTDVIFFPSWQVWWQNSSTGFLQQDCSTFHPLNKNNVTFATFALAPNVPDT